MSPCKAFWKSIARHSHPFSPAGSLLPQLNAPTFGKIYRSSLTVRYLEVIQRLHIRIRESLDVEIRFDAF